MRFAAAALGCLSVFANYLNAQTVTASGGTAGTIPLYDSSGSNLVNSNIYQASTGTPYVGLPNSLVNFTAWGSTITGTDNVTISGAINAGVFYLGDTNNYIRSVFNGGLRLGTNSSPDALVIQEHTGQVGIATSNPGFKLEVNGSSGLTSGSGASLTFPDGSVQSLAWDGTTGGGDYAETVDVLRDPRNYSPGDVIAIVQSTPGKFDKSIKPNSRLVAGVFSTKPGLVGRRLTTPQSPTKQAIPMALKGIVPTKVCLEGGSIAVGDLLVSSSKPGYAMKARADSVVTGTVIGKALAPLTSSTGMVEVLLTLR